MSPDPPSGGFMHLLPTYIPEGMTLTGMSAAMLPWFSPAYSGVVGTTQQDPPSPALAVTFEWPISWLRTVEPVPKFEREWLCIRRYSADQALATGTHAYANVEPGTDPPDAVAMTDQGSQGLESTSLTVEGRRGVHALFLALRRRLQEHEPAMFSKLAGHLVYVWFDDPNATGLDQPHKRSDKEAIDQLVEQLTSYEPRGQQLWVPSGPLPQTSPELPLATTTSGAKFYAIPLVMSAPSSMLFTVAGFEVGLAYTTFLTAQTAWNEVQRLVDSHDKPGVDLLLITAGAPDQHGYIYPAEEAVANFLLEEPLGLARQPEHIKQIVLHSWMTGRATLIHPAVSHLFGPLYQSLVPLHHPLTPTTTSSS